MFNSDDGENFIALERVGCPLEKAYPSERIDLKHKRSLGRRKGASSNSGISV